MAQAAWRIRSLKELAELVFGIDPDQKPERQMRPKEDQAEARTGVNPLQQRWLSSCDMKRSPPHKFPGVPSLCYFTCLAWNNSWCWLIIYCCQALCWAVYFYWLFPGILWCRYTCWSILQIRKLSWPQVVQLASGGAETWTQSGLAQRLGLLPTVTWEVYFKSSWVMAQNDACVFLFLYTCTFIPLGQALFGLFLNFGKVPQSGISPYNWHCLPLSGQSSWHAVEIVLPLSWTCMVPEYHTPMGSRPLSLLSNGLTMFSKPSTFSGSYWKLSFWDQFASGLDSSWAWFPKWLSKCLRHMSLVNSSQNAHVRGLPRVSHEKPVLASELCDSRNFPRVAFPSASDLLIVWLSLVPNPFDSGFKLSLLMCLFIHSVQFSSVAQLCPTLCSMNCSTLGLLVHHQLPEFTQSHIHRVSDAIQLSHPLSSPSPPAPNPSQHQSLFQWVNSSHKVAKVLEFQL